VEAVFLASIEFVAFSPFATIFTFVFVVFSILHVVPTQKGRR
jgi:hypothetical protein